MALTTTVIRTLPELEALEPEWQSLYEASMVANPFAHPTWQLAWTRRFVPAGALRCVVVRDGDRLVGVAPFFLDAHRASMPRLGARLRQVGSGPNAAFTELPQVLAAARLERRVLREVVSAIAQPPREWDWADLSLPPEQRWFEQEWLPQTGPAAGCVAVHTGAEACVVAPLAGSWDAFRASLKSSAKEAIRRSTRGLERDGHRWSVAFGARDGSTTRAALDDFAALHSARAAFGERTARADYLQSDADRAFLFALADRTDDLVTPCVLYIDDAPAAGVIALRANGVLFFAITGFDPAWWRHSPLTLLQAECLRWGIEQGDTEVNFSLGPTVAKLRWSEQIRQYNRFTIVSPTRRSRLAYAAFTQLRALGQARRIRRNAGTPSLERGNRRATTEGDRTLGQSEMFAQQA